MKSKEKNFLWNNMNGTMIFLLILSEILYAFQSTPKICLILKTVCLFHIPILVFVSGYLTKNEENDNKLVLFYLIGNFILMWSFFLFNNTNFNLLIPYYSLWYLLSLFMWKKSIKTFNSIKLIFNSFASWIF